MEKQTTKKSLKDLVVPHFFKFWVDTKNADILTHVLKGGRGSGKSSVIATKLVIDVIKYPLTVLCVRKVGNTLQESCFEQIKEAIGYLGLEDKFEYKLSPLRIIYKPRGNSIIFRGADNPLKIKSIKMAKYPIARLWIEELAEFKFEDEVSTIVNSVLRAELPEQMFYKIYFSYNPPKMRQSWVNVKFESAIIASNTRVYHSTYKDNPYISSAFKEEAEHVKKLRPQKYEWEYLGKAIGAGVIPFGNLKFEKITDEQIAQFDNIRQGGDWGYATDPFAWIRLHYDKTRRTIYLFDEIEEVKLSNRMASKRIKAKGLQHLITIFDSAEPKSIAEVQDYGIRAEGAMKGADSVVFGEKWLDDLDAIIIDPERCPNATREFESIDYATDRYGNPIPRLEDKDNHLIDATRYALNKDMQGNNYSFE